MNGTALRMGVVGATGLFAPTYLNPAIDLPDLELRAIAARRPGPLAETAAAYGNPDTHTDWRELGGAGRSWTWWRS